MTWTTLSNRAVTFRLKSKLSFEREKKSLVFLMIYMNTKSNKRHSLFSISRAINCSFKLTSRLPCCLLSEPHKLFSLTVRKDDNDDGDSEHSNVKVYKSM